MERLYQQRRRRRKVILAALLVIIAYMKDSLPDRKIWIRHYVARRKKQGCHHNLFLELQLEDPEKFRR